VKGLIHIYKYEGIFIWIVSAKKVTFPITNSERKTIKKFQEYRNELFHGVHPFFFNLSDKEKDEIMDNAVNAAELTRDIGFRKAVS